MVLGSEEDNKKTQQKSRTLNPQDIWEQSDWRLSCKVLSSIRNIKDEGKIRNEQIGKKKNMFNGRQTLHQTLNSPKCDSNNLIRPWMAN